MKLETNPPQLSPSSQSFTHCCDEGNKKIYSDQPLQLQTERETEVAYLERNPINPPLSTSSHSLSTGFLHTSCRREPAQLVSTTCLWSVIETAPRCGWTSACRRCGVLQAILLAHLLVVVYIPFIAKLDCKPVLTLRRNQLSIWTENKNILVTKTFTYVPPLSMMQLRKSQGKYLQSRKRSGEVRCELYLTSWYAFGHPGVTYFSQHDSMSLNNHARGFFIWNKGDVC